MDFSQGGILSQLWSFVERHTTQLIWAVGGLTLLALVAWWLTFYHARVTIQPTPANAVIAIDGVERPAATRVKLKPGAHTVTVSLGDHIPFEQTITVKSGLYVTLPVTLRSVPHLKFVTHDDVADLSLDAESGFTYYRNRSQRRTERVTVSAAGPGKPELLTPSSLAAVDEWRWAPGYELGLMRNGTRWALYDLARHDLVHQSTTDWPDGVGDVRWSPRAESRAMPELIHAFAGSDGERSLIRTDPRHSTADRVLNFRGTELEEPTVAWIGDGSSIILRSKPGTLWRFTVYSKALEQIQTEQPIEDFLSSPDGQRLVTRDNQGQLNLLSIDGKETKALSRTEALNHLAWSADSKHLWIVGDGSNRTLTRIDATSGSSTKYTVGSESLGEVTAIAISKDETALILAGTQGLATVMIEPSDYPPVNFEE